MQKYLKPIIALASFYSTNWVVDILSMLVLVFYNPNFVTLILTGNQTEEQSQILHSPTAIGTTQIIAAIIIIIFLLQTRILEWEKKTKIKSINWKYASMGIFGAFLLYMSFEEITYLLFAYAKNESISPQNDCVYYGIMLSTYYIVFSPLVEECIFRGGILGNLVKEGIDKWWAIVISAAIFGIAHFEFDRILPCFVFGIVTGWIYTKTKSLIPSLILHILNNGVSVGLMAFGHVSIYDFILMDISLAIRIILFLALIATGIFLSYQMIKKYRVAGQN